MMATARFLNFSGIKWLTIILAVNAALWFLSPAQYLAAYYICGNTLFIPLILFTDRILRKGRKDHFVLWAVLIGCFAVFVSLSPVTMHSGWPDNHEGYAWKYRISNYYLHFLQLDFLPIWSSGDCFGMGSPLPLYYHKLFYHIAAAIYLLLAKMKLSILLALAVFELAGIAGMYRAFRTLNLQRWLALPLSLSLLLMNYTATDWLIRGNMAEFSALCLLPWLLFACFRIIQQKKMPLFLSLVLWLLYLAHNIIAFYGVFLIGIAVAIDLSLNYSAAYLKQTLRRIGISSLLFLGLNTIYFIPMIAISDDYDPGKIRLGMEVEHRFEELGKYFFDREYIWGNTWEGLSLEFSQIFLAFGLFTFTAWLLQTIKSKNGGNLRFRKTTGILKNENFLFIALSLLFFFFLQSQWSLFFYKIIPGANFIQFPWRLLTFIQILALLLLGYLLNELKMDWFKPEALAWLLLLCMIVSYPFLRKFNPQNYNWFAESEIERMENNGVWGTAGEYIPIIEGVDHLDQSFYLQLAAQGIRYDSSAQIVISAVDNENPEELRRAFKVESETELEITLPFNYSGLEEVYYLDSGIKKPLHTYRIRTDSRIRVSVPKGKYLLFVDLPTLTTSFRNAFAKLF